MDNEKRKKIQDALCDALRGDQGSFYGMLEDAIKKGIDPNFDHGYILRQLQNKPWNIQPMLSMSGVSVNAINCVGETALMNAIWYENITNVRMLLEAKADPNLRRQPNGISPLSFALQRNKDQEISKLLIQKGADIFATRNSHLFHFATSCARRSIAQNVPWVSWLLTLDTGILVMSYVNSIKLATKPSDSLHCPAPIQIYQLCAKQCVKVRHQLEILLIQALGVKDLARGIFLYF